MYISKRRTAFAALMVSTACVAAPAFAQTTAATPEVAAAPQDQGDIIVTAQKRDENIQDVPISIQALGTRKLDQLNVTSFAD